MRNKTVTVNGKQIVVKEIKIKELRTEVLPKLMAILDTTDLKDKQVSDFIPLVEEKLSEFFPDLTPEDIEEAYPSDIENLINAYIDVNFSGLKKMVKPLFGFLRTGMSN